MPETRRHRLARYAIVSMIVLVVGGLFVQREFLGDEASAALGPLDDRTVARDQPAPDFAVESLDGEVLRLSDYRGRIVVLNFWASWCEPCRHEMPEFEAAYRDRLAADDFIVLAVNALALDSRVDATEFIDAIGVTFPTAYDTPEGAVATRYGIRGLPATFFIDREGVIRAMTLGPVFGDLLTDGIAAADAGAASGG
jgi:peroxiredoxin